jgi:hypothetical protein
VLRTGLLQLGESDHERALQRLVPVHGQFRPLHHGRSDFELQRAPELHRLQRRKSSFRRGSTGGFEAARNAHLPTQGLRSKAWDEFALPGSPQLDFVFTVCDNAQKVCPVWPGQPMTAHWGVPDPAAVRGSQAEIERAFREAFFILDRRISLFLCLPLKSLDRLALKRELDSIGQTMTPIPHE